jgi:magnesium chelatase family protein
MEIYGYAPWGYEGDLVSVEVDLRRGIPGMEIVGLPGGAVREARDRLRIALRRAGFEFPMDRILVNLGPADLPKTGSGYDLPMALALLQASGQWNSPVSCLLAMGELTLDGRLRRVPGILAAAQRCRSAGIEALAIPEEALNEAACVGGAVACGPDLGTLVRTLAERPRAQEPVMTKASPLAPAMELRGQPKVKRALEVAAAGGHSLLLYGPPGAGKTLAARSLEQLLPPLAPEAALETTRLWSLGGILPRNQGLLTRRPFRAPHHSASAEGLLGGGKTLVPGEVSLAHHGVLFLDEAPEFSARVLQSLREPLEQGSVSVARAGRTAWFPSRFQLVLTANACPCGQSGRQKGVCFCSALEVRKYWDRVGTALLDRVELRLFVTPESPSRLLETSADHSLSRIDIAQERRVGRGQDALVPNSALAPRDLERFCALDQVGVLFLTEAAEHQGWSSRALHSLLRVARTLADLDGRERVRTEDLEESVSLRKPEGEEYWER